MKKYKKLISSLLFLCILLSNTFVSSGSVSDIVVSIQINNPIMEINGTETEIDAGRKTAPVIVNGRTLVPIRAIIEAFGGTAEWNEANKTISLAMNADTITLTIGSDNAYFNDSYYTLDTAPAIMHERTMLPIRFIAESFNLGVGWNSDTETVYIVSNHFDEQEYSSLIAELPEYSGAPFTQINSNIPFFKDYEIIDASFEYYSSLDNLGRCSVCIASIASDIMPAEEERKSISSVTPTGWQNASYDNIPGRYLYNRCHLIGYQLTGENANKKNLITGTRYLNMDGMLPFENLVDSYIDETDGRVIYRATPVFKENNLVADGVLLEAYSVGDSGQGISFCVYCYNVQPGIKIDYKTGANTSEEFYSDKNNAIDSNIYDSADIDDDPLVYRTPSGKKYHFDPECGGKNSYEITLEDAIDSGLTPCAKCAA